VNDPVSCRNGSGGSDGRIGGGAKRLRSGIDDLRIIGEGTISNKGFPAAARFSSSSARHSSSGSTYPSGDRKNGEFLVILSNFDQNPPQTLLNLRAVPVRSSGGPLKRGRIASFTRRTVYSSAGELG
jgi:hypothetical protein